MSSIYRINEFAKRVGRSVQTVRRALLGIASDKKDIVVNCEVSGVVQKDELQ